MTRAPDPVTRSLMLAELARVEAIRERDNLSSVSLEQLLEDETLGALPLSPAQRALARAADGLPVTHLDPARLGFHFGLNGGLSLVPPERPRVVVVRTGVRSGKSLIGAFAALLLSAIRCKFRRPPDPNRPEERPGADGLVGVRPGELVRALIVAPLLKASRQPFHHLLGSLRSSARLSKLILGDPGVESLDIRRADGGVVRVELVAASSGGLNLRSTWLAGILFDEADFHDDDGAAVNLEDNYRAVTTRVLPDGQIWVVSSPFDDTGTFHKMHTSIFGEPGRRLAFHSDSLSMNPTIPIADIEAERQRDPDNAAREFDAVPLTGGSLNFFPQSAIVASCTRTAPFNLQANASPHWAGADLGFRKNSSALALARWQAGRIVLAYYEELRPEKGAALKPSEVYKSFARTCLTYRATSMSGDAWYLDSALEHVASEVGDNGQTVTYEPWHPSPRAQSEAFTHFRRLMLEGSLELPADPRLIKQLEDTRMKKLPSGEMTVVLPKHGAAHGDLLMAIVLACVQVPVDGGTEHEMASNLGDDAGAFTWGDDRGFG